MGTGGLVRAFTDAAKACIAATDIVKKRRMVPEVLVIDYTYFGKIQYILSNEGIMIKNTDYGKDVILRTEIFIDDVERIEKTLMEATSARITFKKEETVFTV